MTYYNQTATPERAVHQQFTGQIDMLSSQQGHETISTPVVTAELTPHDSIEVSGESALTAPFGRFGGQPVLAEISMGENGSTRLHAIKVDSGSSAEILSIAAKLGVNAEKSDQPAYLLALVEGLSPSVTGYTVVRPSTGFGMIGRHSNMSWLDGSLQNLGYDENSNNISPIGNPSVSREQFVVASTGKGFQIRQSSNVTNTIVRTTATAEHQAIIEANAADTEASVPKRSKFRTVVGQLAVKKTR